jgi:hypothetical protein
MPDDTTSDPYAGTGFEKGTGRITERDTTSGARDGAYARQNIINSFIGFGYYPTEAEVASLIGTSMGEGGSEFGAASVANYVNMQKAEIEREKNDPLAAFQKKMMDSADLYKTQVQGLYGQLQDTLGSAPQLFGNLTPDQIDTYLAPLKRSFDTQLANVQSVMGSRGLSSSSSENNALAATGEQFKEGVLSTGLNVGMQSQQAKAKAISDQINALLGLAGGEERLGGAAASQRSSQALGQSNLIQSLPFFLSQAAKQNQLFQGALDSKGGFQDTFNQVTGDISQGMNAFQTLAMVPGQFKTASPQSSASGPNLPGYPGMFSSSSPAAATPATDLFATGVAVV